MKTACLVLLLLVAPILGSLAHALPLACPPQPTHAYLGSGAVAFGSEAGQQYKVGSVRVLDTNVEDCDGDGVPGDFDGDYDGGYGGAFFGWGPWADEPVCRYGLNVHGPDVAVADFMFPPIFELGADDMEGPFLFVDPSTGEVSCVTDGLISPGLDGDDCLTLPYGPSPFSGVTGTTCGAGGDGGYWVILDAPAYAGIVTAGWFGAEPNELSDGAVRVIRP